MPTISLELLAGLMERGDINIPDTALATEQEIERSEIENKVYEKFTTVGEKEDIALGNAKLFGQFFSKYGARNEETKKKFYEWFDKFEVRYDVTPEELKNELAGNVVKKENIENKLPFINNISEYKKTINETKKKIQAEIENQENIYNDKINNINNQIAEAEKLLLDINNATVYIPEYKNKKKKRGSHRKENLKQKKQYENSIEKLEKLLGKFADLVGDSEGTYSYNEAVDNFKNSKNKEKEKIVQDFLKFSEQKQNEIFEVYSKYRSLKKALKNNKKRKIFNANDVDLQFKSVAKTATEKIYPQTFRQFNYNIIFSVDKKKATKDYETFKINNIDVKFATIFDEIRDDIIIVVPKFSDVKKIKTEISKKIKGIVADEYIELNNNNPNIYYQTKNNIKVKPVEIELDSVPNFEKIADLKKWIEDSLNLLGDVQIKNNNRTVHFSKSNIGRSMKGINRNSTKRNSYAGLKELVENAVYGYTKKADERHSKRNDGQEIYHNAFIYNGEVYGIEISIDIPKNKNTIHSYAGHKIKIMKKAPEINGTNLPDLTGANISINDIRGLFNPNVKNNVNVMFQKQELPKYIEEEHEIEYTEGRTVPHYETDKELTEKEKKYLDLIKSKFVDNNKEKAIELFRKYNFSNGNYNRIVEVYSGLENGSITGQLLQNGNWEYNKKDYTKFQKKIIQDYVSGMKFDEIVNKYIPEYFVEEQKFLNLFDDYVNGKIRWNSGSNGIIKKKKIKRSILNPKWYPLYNGTKEKTNEIIEHYEENVSTDKIGNGYSNYSMSNNAVKAYEQGSMPLSKWSKKNIIARINNIVEMYNIPFDTTKLSNLKLAELKEKFLKNVGYHHTSKFYNITDFYNIDIEKILPDDDKAVDVLKTYYQSANNDNQNVVDLTDDFDKTPTLQEVKEYINEIVEKGTKFATLSPEWFIDIKKEDSNKKQNRITNKILNNGNFLKLDKPATKRHNKYVMSLEKLLANAEYLNQKENTKPDKKPNVAKYHYFKTDVKIGDKIYEIIFDTEEYKNEISSAGNYDKSRSLNPPLEDTNSITDNKENLNPKTVHLYNISEKKKSSVLYQNTNEDENLIAGFTYQEVMDKLTEIWDKLGFEGLDEETRDKLMTHKHILEKAFDISEHPEKFSNEDERHEVMLNAYYIMNNQEIPQNYIEADKVSNKSYNDWKEIHEKKKEEKENEYYGYFSETSDKNIITIMSNSNSSTALHELGHLFLNGLNELAKVDEGARKQLEAVNKWLGYSGEYTIAQQEKFARSFEAYLEIKMQLTYCQNVYCGVVKSFTPLAVGDLTITSEMVKKAFKVKNGEG